MSYRIQVDPDASVLLRTLSPHVVLGIGRTLAELAEAADGGGLASGDLRTFEVAGCTVLYEVQGDDRSLIVRHVERREVLASAPAEPPQEAAAG